MAQAEPKKSRFVLVVVSGLDEGKEFLVGNEPVTIGRRKTNAVALSDEKVSLTHARISKEGDLYLLSDNGSTNGTYIGSRRIESEVISHNTLFTVGDTTLLFKEKERLQERVSAGQGREIEQEEEFAEIDLVQALKAEKTSPVATFLYSVAAVFLILSILYFGFVIFGRIFRSTSTEFPSASLISANWSFEQKGAQETLPGWLIQGKGWSVDESVKRSGKRALLFDCSSRGSDEGIEAKYERPVAAKPQTDYVIRVWIKTEDILRCGVKFTWIDERNREFKYNSYSCLVSGTTDLSPVKGVVSPPLRATQFEVSLFALGDKGRCWFDDVEVEEQPAQVESARSRVIALGDRMKAVFDARATWEIYRYSTLTLWGAQVALQQDGELPLISRQSLCEIEEDFAKGTDLQARFSGRIFDCATNRWLPLNLSISAENDRITFTGRLSGQLQEGTQVGFLFFLSARVLDERGVELSTADSLQTKRGEFQLDGVREIIWGSGDTILSVSYEEPVRLSASKDGSIYRVFTARHPKRQEKEVQISATFSHVSFQEAQRVEETLAQAERLRREGRLSAAHDLATRARESMAKTSEARAQFDIILAKIEEDSKALSEELKKVSQDARKTLHTQIINSLEKLTEKTELAFPDSDTARRSRELLNSVKEVAKASEGEKTAGKARLLLDIAKGYKERGALNLAAVCYEYVRDSFPDTEWQKEAVRQLEIIEHKKRIENRW